MGFFDRLFGRKPAPFSLPEPAPEPPPFDGLAKKPAAPPSAATSVSTAPLPEEGGPMVEVFDHEGNRLQIPRQKWLEVVMGNMQNAWNDEDALAGMIMGGFDDGFFTEMVAPAERLAEMDSNKERGASLLSVAYLKTGRLEDAARVLEDHVARHGESAVVLTNLAKVWMEKNDREKGLAMLERALQLDPNLDNALGCHLAEVREAHGEAGELKALEEIAAREGSWRAQLWLARKALQKGELDAALALYQDSLAHAGDPAPADLLVQMSGDLGRQAHLVELLDLTAPRFQPELHGLPVGGNLLKAYLDLGQAESARMILDRLYAMKRPDWKAALRFWEGEIAKSGLQTLSTEPDEKVQLTMAGFEGPAWLNPHSPAAELFPVREEGGPTVCFLAASMEKDEEGPKPDPEAEGLAGRLSRALPLLFAEQAHFHSDARVSTLIPRVLGRQGAFAVMGGAWADGDAAAFARRGESSSEYVVTAHLRLSGKNCGLELRVIRTIDGSCLKSLEGSFAAGQPEAAVLKLKEELLAVLADEAGASRLQPPPAYALPEGPVLTGYLVALDQLLGVRCAATEETRTDFLHGERDILDGMIRLVRACPQSVSVRVLLTQCFQTMKRARPDILAEFEDTVQSLQSQHPLPEVPQAVMDRLLREVFA